MQKLISRICAGFVLMVILAAVLSSCSKADVASSNLSKAADNFEVTRRVHFYNGITGEDFLVIEGRCSLGNSDEPGSLSVTCKVAENSYKKFFLGLSDNVTYWTEDLNPSAVDVYIYRVILRPTTVIPGLELDVP